MHLYWLIKLFFFKKKKSDIVLSWVFDNMDRIRKPSRNGFLVGSDLTKLYFSIPKGERESYLASTFLSRVFATTLFNITLSICFII